MRYENENIWLTQKMMAALYDVSIAAINQHIKKVYDDSELEPESTIKKFKVNNERAVQFRKWANGIVKDYTIKGWVMDDERLKNGGSVLTVEYCYNKL